MDTSQAPGRRCGSLGFDGGGGKGGGGDGKFHYVSAITLEGELRILSKFHVTANLLRSLTQM